MLSREHTGTSDVLARSHPSRDSVFAAFDRDNDAPVSMGHFDKDDDVQEDEELDYAIDTSALHRALPQFTDISSSDESEAPSIEISRGGRKVSHQTDYTHSSIFSPEDSKPTASPAIRRDELPESRLPRPALRAISNRTAMKNQDSLRKDAQIRRASHVSQKENLDPKALKVRGGRQVNLSRRPSKTQRRTLSDMHAKVMETYEDSYLSDERPHSADAMSRNTRFGSNRTQKKTETVMEAVNNAAGRTYGEIEVGTTADVTEDPTDTNDVLREATNPHESFLLPDIPDLSELVSGIYQEAMPVKSRNSRSRTTRFASPPAVTITAAADEHVPFDGVPIPDDEKAIFASLRLLQEKVSTLENENLLAEQRVEDLQVENQLLRAEQSKSQKAEQRKARVYKGGDQDSGRGAATLAIQKSRLEAANMALQNRLDIANHKISGHEGNMRRVMKERDSVMNKLGVAYLSCQELRSQNEALRRENEELDGQLSLLTSMPKLEQSNSDVLSKSRALKDDTTSRRKPRRRKNSESANEENSSIQNLPDVPRETRRNDRKSNNFNNHYNQLFESGQHDDAKSKQEQQENQYDELFSLDLSKRRGSRSREHRRESQPLFSEKKEPNTSKQRIRKSATADDSDMSDIEVLTTSKHRGRGTQDLTFLSFIDGREIALLRKTLEEERIARKQRRAQEPTRSILKNAAHVDTLQSEKFPSAPAMNKESGDPTESARNPISRTLKHSSHGDEEGTAAHEMTQDTRSLSDRQRDLGDMTSAIILPDITWHGVKISAATQRVLDEVANHKKENCFVCHETKKRGSSDMNSSASSVKVPKPIPVSERTPAPTAYNEEPTLRPSQPPSAALASVLKGLEDELAHLKMQLTVFQTTYAKHDPSLGKRQRKGMCQKIASLMTEIEKKSDQIYSLYDVLEGQKKHGEEMTDEQVEVTLESLGVAPAGNFPAKFAKQKQAPQSKAEPNDSDDGELPWEGFDSTIESTRRSLGQRG
ncbi:predicted protein [Uncinocarpus reesii 1704]|uniref:Cep57 centrosome microtubule-binding domain-containing protein n=1 Tax=Uncinocarpus reesii (strain UAMH 1704) TaxID=336963 RepID=C4JG98_UNCRE|nr:uncharacterized protein UREG_02496 [Uncinocarpus reesii 1704]EEP77647.1 predicted protein [Uncinocarpus reesii 1704]